MEMVPLRWTRCDKMSNSIEFDVQFSFITYFQQVVIYLILIVQLVNEQVEVEI